MTHPLDDLLDQTHRALLAGDLALLGRLGDRVQDLADTPSAMDADTARRLRRKADRNALLLQSALRGLRAARGRLADLAEGATLTTYDALGRKARLTVTPTATKRL